MVVLLLGSQARENFSSRARRQVKRRIRSCIGILNLRRKNFCNSTLSDNLNRGGWFITCNLLSNRHFPINDFFAIIGGGGD